MTTIRSYQNHAQAAFYLSLLTGNGFESVLLDETAHDYAIIAPIRLQVRDEQVEEANTFLESAPPAPGELPPTVE
jgi:hypothetical protein